MKDVNLSNTLSCQPDQGMMFLTGMYFLSFFWITQYFFSFLFLFCFWIGILGALENGLSGARYGAIYLGQISGYIGADKTVWCLVR
jgi:hypothetical protein